MKAIFVKDKQHTITAQYPDIESKQEKLEPATSIELMSVNHLLKVSEGEFNLSVWKVLCYDCRRAFCGYKIISISLLACEQCHRKPEN